MCAPTATVPAEPQICVDAGFGSPAAGELADHIARRLQRLGAVKLSCRAGGGRRIPPRMAPVQKAAGILMSDGYPLAGGANVLRNSGFTNFKQLKLHELGVRKNDSKAVDEITVARLTDEALRLLNQPS